MEFKLQDLAKIALGSADLTNVNIAVLQSLIEILLKKLNCQSEAVILSSFEGNKLQNLLNQSKLSPLAIDDEKIEVISDKLQRLLKLEQVVQTMDEKLSCHLEESSRQSNQNETTLQLDNWQNFNPEDLCTICNPDNVIACKLLKNTDFLKKLLRRISAPMVDRVFQLENKIAALEKEFNAFIARTEEHYLKIQLLEKCLHEIELLRKKINENQTQFICVMEEVQDMLDAKLDKIHVPALKKYIKDNFLRISREINDLQAREECPRAAGIIMSGLQCMSCGSANICRDVGSQSVAMLPDSSKKLDSALLKHCATPSPNDNISKRKKIKAISKSVGVENISSRWNAKATCGVVKGEKLQLLEGFDGNLYRKG
ncbi:uncharacterized protein LOC133327487 [Musca vetustissima]|uniref:uncharacterized protein LOC133327487 n=1 Tax=Musca vetustissima TaxID=27455 RepID=UPI002AB68B12|nr:uncharacterized protein LOC133327487 [Musca vetustissima]